MDLGLAFSFPFQDKEWVKKVAIAAVIFIIPVIGWIIVFGWAIEITRRVIRASEETLPDWNDFAEYMMLGFKGFLIALVYSIPIMLLTVPVFFLSWFDTDLGGVIAILSLCTSCISFFYSLVFGVALPAGFGILADSDNLADAINPSKIFEVLRAAPSAYVIVLIGGFIASIVSGIGVIACFIGVLFTTAYALAIQGHLIGQAYNEASKAL
jgi:hypothetical protein